MNAKESSPPPPQTPEASTESFDFLQSSIHPNLGKGPLKIDPNSTKTKLFKYHINFRE
jgi:hypothetical protein